MKEQIGIMIQILSVGIVAFAVLPRQLRDLSVQGDIPDIVKIKRTMTLCSIGLIVFGLIPIVRMAAVIMTGDAPPWLEDAAFWANRMILPVVVYTGFMLYHGNQYEGDPEELPKKSRKQ